MAWTVLLLQSGTSEPVTSWIIVPGVNNPLSTSTHQHSARLHCTSENRPELWQRIDGEVPASSRLATSVWQAGHCGSGSPGPARLSGTSWPVRGSAHQQAPVDAWHCRRA